MKEAKKRIQRISQEKGITLIALVITIVIIIILATVTINMAFRQGGLIKQAEDARDYYINDTKYTEESLANVTAYLNEMLSGNEENTLITDITITPIEVTLKVGETSQLTANIQPSNASNKEVIWNSNNDSIASVSNSGLVTAKTEGTTIITATTTDGSNKSASCNITVKRLATNSEELEEGDYVTYVDGTGISRKCALLYDSSSEYGVQIITMESVEDVELGNGTENSQFNNETYFNTARDSYNNVTNILNTKARAYLNTNYASSARCVGTIPDNPDYDTTSVYTRDIDWFVSYNNTFKIADENYLTDYNQMSTLNISSIGKDYWIATRQIGEDDRHTGFRVRYINTNGTIGNINFTFCYVFDGNRGSASYGYIYGLRPVFTLNSGLKITGGNGTESSPYTLGA